MGGAATYLIIVPNVHLADAALEFDPMRRGAKNNPMAMVYGRMLGNEPDDRTAENSGLRALDSIAERDNQEEALDLWAACSRVHSMRGGDWTGVSVLLPYVTNPTGVGTIQ